MQADGSQGLCAADRGPGDITVSDADTDDSGDLSEAELLALTVSQLKRIADEMGITLTATKKAGIIEEILAAQAAAAEDNADPDNNADPDDNAAPDENTPGD